MRARFLIVLPALMLVGISGAGGQDPNRPLQEQTQPPATPSDQAGSLRSMLGQGLSRSMSSQLLGESLAEKGRMIEANVQKLLSEHRTASDEANRTKIESELKVLLKEQFTARQAIRAAEIARLEEQIKQLRGVLDERNKQSERIVDDRLQHLLRNAHGLGWGGEADNSRLSADSSDANRASQDRFRIDSGSSDSRRSK
jgi:hypothetical protein